jgi:putative serine protease PepD
MSDDDERPARGPRPGTAETAETAETAGTAWWSTPEDDPWAAPRTPAGEPTVVAAASGRPWTESDTLGRPEQPRRRTGSIVALAAVLSLLAGGVAGGVAGYVAGREEPAPSSGITLEAAPEGRVDRAPDSVAGIAARVLPGVVKVEVQGLGDTGTGTGFVIDEAGYIVTNNHVVASAAEGRIEVQFSDKQTAQARIVGRDGASDLAVLRVSGVRGLTKLALGNSDTVAVGDPVVAVGSPLGLAGTVTSGIISAKNRAVTAGATTGETSYINALQTDAAINPGNSGGPLVNARGEVIGVNSAIASLGQDSPLGGQSGSIGLGFAIPINLARRTVEQLINTGTATHPIIGATLDPRYIGDGARILEQPSGSAQPIVPGGPADQAGLQPGDVIVAIDGEKVSGSDELIVGIRSRQPGETIELTVDRNGQELRISVVLGSSSG